jgi:radial spoke head protein 4/6
VCNALGDTALTRLPNVRPEQIAAARTLKRLLTGSLAARVSTYPPFPWDEAVFLRAQIARIAAATVLAPAGWLTAEEDDAGKSTLVAAEEIEPMGLPDGEPEEWLANWVHRWAAPCSQHGSCKPIFTLRLGLCVMAVCEGSAASGCCLRCYVCRARSWRSYSQHKTPFAACRNAHLKRQGRCETKPIRELPEDTEEEVTLEADEQEEPPEGGQVLAPVSGDAKVAGGAAWAPIFSSASRATKGQVAGVRSAAWPGAAAVTAGALVANVYVGWGLKAGAYVPLPPPPVAREFDQAQLASVDLPVKADPDAAAPTAEGAEDEEE